jgi:pantothenate kinase
LERDPHFGATFFADVRNAECKIQNVYYILSFHRHNTCQMKQPYAVILKFGILFFDIVT